MWTHNEIVVYIAATIFMGLATFGAVLVALFGKKFFPPKLKIILANPLGELTKWEMDGKVHSARFYQARVINTRRWSPATNISLHLIAVEEERSNHNFSDEWKGDVQLKWKHPSHYPQPSFIGKPVDYDLVSVGAEKCVSLHPIAAASSLNRVRSEKCRFRVWLQARATESDSPVVGVEISWDGTWAEARDEMSKHFIISPVGIDA
jgi:hypothetical protein